MNKLILGVAVLALTISIFAMVRSQAQSLSAGRAQTSKADQRLSQLEKRLDDLSDDVMAIMRAQGGDQKEVPSKAGDPSLKLDSKDAQRTQAPSGVAAPAAERLDSRLAALENKLRHRNPFGQWIATSEELEAELRLSKDQSTQVERLFNEVKDQAFELLSIANEEGVAPLDEMAEDFRQGMEFKPALDRLVKRMEATIPGTGETYAERMQGIERVLFERLEGSLDDSQFERLKKADIAPTMIQTGYDPVGEYIRKSLETKGGR